MEDVFDQDVFDPPRCLTKMCLTLRGRQVLRDVAIRRVPLALRKQLQADVKPRAAPAAAPARRATFRSNLRAREAPPADAEETALVSPPPLPSY